MGYELFGYDIEEKIPLLGISLWMVIGFLAALVVGYVIVKVVLWALGKSLRRAGVDEIMSEFTTRILGVVLYIFVFGFALGFLGLNLGAALLGISIVMGFVLGFALGDTLSNIAAGFMIAMTKPFKAGDFVETSGQSGTIRVVGVSSTQLDTGDNKRVIIPNRLVWSSNVVNYTRNDTRRIDMEIGVSYEEDLDRVIRTTQKILRSHPMVLKDPEPQVEVKDMADSAVILVVRPWVKTEDYWNAFFQLKKSIKKRFDSSGITIPFPQMDVHVKKE